MSLATPNRSANPRLGLLFGVYASALVAVGLVVLLLEQLGVGDGVLRAAMFGLPLVLFLGVGAAAMSRDAQDFHSAGRRVPPFFSGLATAVSGLGGFGLVILTGCVFLMGSDAFALLLGFPAGNIEIAGFVEVREERERSDRVVVRALKLEGARIEHKPGRVRVSVRKGTAPPVGAYVTFRARLNPPLAP